MWISVWVFNLIPLINISVYVPIKCSFYYSISGVQLEIGNGDTSYSSFIIQNCFSFHVLFCLLCVCVCVYVFSFEAEIFPFKICKQLCWNFEGVSTESVDFF